MIVWYNYETEYKINVKCIHINTVRSRSCKPELPSVCLRCQNTVCSLWASVAVTNPVAQGNLLVSPNFQLHTVSKLCVGLFNHWNSKVLVAYSQLNNIYPDTCLFCFRRGVVFSRRLRNGLFHLPSSYLRLRHFIYINIFYCSILNKIWK